jgi:phosphatidylethanolamine/phosphatidyl-N-methylethanolamine N-methyltransferase
MRGQQQRGTEQRRKFWQSWLRNPRQIGAIAPSSRLLAALMARGLEPGARVLELGAGTGSVTTAILTAGVRPQDLCIVEQSEDFLPLLGSLFPACRVVPADATRLDSWGAALGGPFDYVLSSLPLVLFSPVQRAAVLHGVCGLLAPAGRVHQFTYAGRCPIDRNLRHALALNAELLGVAPLNLPPAFVYRLQRQ